MTLTHPKHACEVHYSKACPKCRGTVRYVPDKELRCFNCGWVVEKATAKVSYLAEIHAELRLETDVLVVDALDKNPGLWLQQNRWAKACGVSLKTLREATYRQWPVIKVIVNTRWAEIIRPQ